METAHRKIELQSPADLTYLQNNATRAAREKIDLHFPPSAAPESGDEDVMKKRVEELVHEYIQRTFANARGNLSINGLEGQEMEEELRRAGEGGEELEPYDTKLATKLKKTAAHIEALTLQLATLRRTAPAQAAAAHASHLSRQDETFKTALSHAETKKLQDINEGDLDIGVGRVRSWQDCERNWENATKGLEEVKNKIGETGARLSQARDAVGYLDQSGR